MQVQLHLYSKKWEARTAASDCIGLLAEHFVHHTPQELAAAAGLPPGSSLDEVPLEADRAPEKDAVLSFAAFDLHKVLESGMPLASSAGQEFDVIDEGVSPGERLKIQRAQIKKRLGAWCGTAAVLTYSAVPPEVARCLQRDVNSIFCVPCPWYCLPLDSQGPMIVFNRTWTLRSTFNELDRN